MEGINNKIWGPIYWRMFHYMTLTYPINPTEENKNVVKTFFTEIVPNILPCPLCRNHFKENLKINPLTNDILEYKLKLVLWLSKMHNYVNKQLGKNEISIEDSLVMLFSPIELYEDEEEEDNNSKYNKEYLENTYKNLINTNNFIIDIDAIMDDKEEEIKNKKILEESENTKKNKIFKLYEKNNLINEETKKNYDKKKEDFDNNIKEIKNKINLPKIENIKEVFIEEQKYVNIEKIILKMEILINKQKGKKNKYLMYTAFETICLLFI
jgi:hypothetical protein